MPWSGLDDRAPEASHSIFRAREVLVSVDLVLFRSNGGIARRELEAVSQKLAPDLMLTGGDVHLWKLPIASFAHREGGQEPDMSPLERTVYTGEFVLLSAASPGWYALLYAASRLASVLDCEVFDPQSGQRWAISEAVTTKVAQAWVERVIAQDDLHLRVTHAAPRGRWQSVEPGVRRDLVVTAVQAASGEVVERRIRGNTSWAGTLTAGSGATLDLTWRGTSRWEPEEVLQIDAPSTSSAEVDALAEHLRQALDADFERVEAYGRRSRWHTPRR